jgi:hypothetical protein
MGTRAAVNADLIAEETQRAVDDARARLGSRRSTGAAASSS